MLRVALVAGMSGRELRALHCYRLAVLKPFSSLRLRGVPPYCSALRRRQNGADHVISVKGKSSVDIAQELKQTTGQKDLDAIMDCAGAPEMMQLAFSLLSISGHYADVGLVGDRIDIPLFPRVSREHTFHGSFWGNNTDLSEVMALAAENKIRHSIKLFKFDEINENIDLLRTGDIVGRAVMKF